MNFTTLLRAGAIAFREQARCPLNSGNEEHLCHTIADGLDKWANITADDDAWNEVELSNEYSSKYLPVPEAVTKVMRRPAPVPG